MPFVGCQNAERANNDMRMIVSVLGLLFPVVESCFLLRTSAIQSLTQTGYGPRPLDYAPTAVFIILSSSAVILNPLLSAPPRNTYPSHPTRLHRDWVAGSLATITFSFHLNWHFCYFRLP